MTLSIYLLGCFVFFFFPPYLFILGEEDGIVRGRFSPPEAAEGLSCYHGNPCLAADLLYAGKGRGKGGREEGKDGLGEEKDANKILRAGFRNGTLHSWLLGPACSCWGILTPGEGRGSPGDVRLLGLDLQGEVWSSGCHPHRASLLLVPQSHPAKPGGWLFPAELLVPRQAGVSLGDLLEKQPSRAHLC